MRGEVRQTPEEGRRSRGQKRRRRKADRKLLLDTFESLDAALFEQNATLLVAANASLRETDAEVEVEVEGKHKKHREARAVLIS